MWPYIWHHSNKIYISALRAELSQQKLKGNVGEAESHTKVATLSWVFQATGGTFYSRFCRDQILELDGRRHDDSLKEVQKCCSV